VRVVFCPSSPPKRLRKRNLLAIQVFLSIEMKRKEIQTKEQNARKQGEKEMRSVVGCFYQDDTPSNRNFGVMGGLKKYNIIEEFKELIKKFL
jgi:hypothetical protein